MMGLVRGGRIVVVNGLEVVALWVVAMPFVKAFQKTEIASLHSIMLAFGLVFSCGRRNGPWELKWASIFMRLRIGLNVRQLQAYFSTSLVLCLVCHSSPHAPNSQNIPTTPTFFLRHFHPLQPFH